MTTKSKIALVFIAIIASILLGILFAWPIQWLWNNALVGSVNGINPITFWEAYGIFLLINLIKPSHSGKN